MHTHTNTQGRAGPGGGSAANGSNGGGTQVGGVEHLMSLLQHHPDQKAAVSAALNAVQVSCVEMVVCVCVCVWLCVCGCVCVCVCVVVRRRDWLSVKKSLSFRFVPLTIIQRTCACSATRRFVCACHLCFPYRAVYTHIHTHTYSRARTHTHTHTCTHTSCAGHVKEAQPFHWRTTSAAGGKAACHGTSWSGL